MLKKEYILYDELYTRAVSYNLEFQLNESINILEMLFNSKEEVCDFVNKKLNLLDQKHEIPKSENFFDWIYYSILSPKKIKIPIYTSQWKLNLLNKIVNKLDYQFHKLDLSRLIWPDIWKYYSLSKPIALTKFTKEHKNCWIMYLNHEFYKENLKYGIRPMSIYNYTTDFGGKIILVLDKENNNIYKIGGSLGVFSELDQDFEKYLSGLKTSIPWGELKI